jgi:glycosyltransferase involved in cell wall biosynthesis
VVEYPTSLRRLKSQSLSIPPDLAVLVRVKNEAKVLPQFLQRIESQRIRERTELIFLDSGSSDGTLDLIRNTNCSVYQIAPEDFAFGTSCNLMMSLSSANVCMFLSGHVLLQSHEVLETVLSRLQGSDPAALYLRQVSGSLFGSTAYERAFLGRRFPDGDGPVLLRSPGSFSNAASALTKSAWERCPFPEVAASEDFLWAKQHLALGGRLEYYPQLTVEHSHRESPEEVYRRVSLNVKSRNIGSSWAKAAKFYVSVFGATLRQGASISEAARYAASHARAYL